jgi:hypothetical protein
MSAQRNKALTEINSLAKAARDAEAASAEADEGIKGALYAVFGESIELLTPPAARRVQRQLRELRPVAFAAAAPRRSRSNSLSPEGQPDVR